MEKEREREKRREEEREDLRGVEGEGDGEIKRIESMKPLRVSV